MIPYSEILLILRTTLSLFGSGRVMTSQIENLLFVVKWKIYLKFKKSKQSLNHFNKKKDNIYPSGINAFLFLLKQLSLKPRPIPGNCR